MNMEDFRNPIFKETKKGSQTRVFRPAEVRQLLKYGIPKLYHKTMFRALLYSGMRYVELQRFQDHPQWFDGEFIHLPAWKASRKHKRKQPDRWVRLNNQGRQVIEYFLELDKKLPGYKGWNKNLECWCRRAEISSVGVSAKCTRKTWESWLMFMYPNRIMDIVTSQGHTQTISIQHYCNMPFNDRDKVEIERFVEGWV